jgi:hypothetical protein
VKFVNDAAATGNPAAIKAAQSALEVILGREGIQQKDTQSQRSLQGDLARAGAVVESAREGAKAETYKADKMVDAAKVRGDGPIKVKRKVKNADGSEREVEVLLDRETGEVVGVDPTAGQGFGMPAPGAANQKQPVRLTPAQVEREWALAQRNGVKQDDFVKRMQQAGYTW